MREDPGFMNDLGDNLGRYRAYLDSAFMAPDDRLAKLQALLDAELQLTHPEQTAP